MPSKSPSAFNSQSRSSERIAATLVIVTTFTVLLCLCILTPLVAGYPHCPVIAFLNCLEDVFSRQYIIPF